MLFWALLASGQITMRKVNGWQTLAEPLTDVTPVDLVALIPSERRHSAYFHTTRYGTDCPARHRQRVGMPAASGVMTGEESAHAVGSPAGDSQHGADARSGTGFHPLRAVRRKPGRRPKLSAAQQALIVDAVLEGRRTAAQMARHFKVSEPTVSRILASYRAAVPAPGVDGPGDAALGVERIAGALPLAALDDRLAIIGASGSGKTYAAKGLVERLLHRGARVCVVDPLGVWWGLRLAADGSAPGPYPVVVFGGRHADVPLTPGMGAALGRLLGTHALACVVDVSDFGSGADRRAFMAAFTEALYGSNAEPLHLVLDEADLWAPQRVPPDGYDLLGRVEEIVRRGRVRGFVPWLVTQRPAVLHKDVLSQADVLVSMKLTSSQDRAAVGRWIEGQADWAEGRRILAALPRLGRGEGWAWAPADGVLARVAFPRIRTLDSSQTPRRRDAVAGAPPTLATLDVSAIRAALAEGGSDEAGPGSGARRLGPDGRPPALDRDAELGALRSRLRVLEAEMAGLRAQLASKGL